MRSKADETFVIVLVLVLIFNPEMLSLALSCTAQTALQ